MTPSLLLFVQKKEKGEKPNATLPLSTREKKKENTNHNQGEREKENRGNTEASQPPIT